MSAAVTKVDGLKNGVKPGTPIKVVIEYRTPSDDQVRASTDTTYRVGLYRTEACAKEGRPDPVPAPRGDFKTEGYLRIDGHDGECRVTFALSTGVDEIVLIKVKE